MRQFHIIETFWFKPDFRVKGSKRRDAKSLGLDAILKLVLAAMVHVSIWFRWTFSGNPMKSQDLVVWQYLKTRPYIRNYWGGDARSYLKARFCGVYSPLLEEGDQSWPLDILEYKKGHLSSHINFLFHLPSRVFPFLCEGSKVLNVFLVRSLLWDFERYGCI